MRGVACTRCAGYSALLGPVTGIVMADYFIVRGRTMDIDSLYRSGKDSIYWYKVRAQAGGSRAA